jgi:hypothetical protein
VHKLPAGRMTPQIHLVARRDPGLAQQREQIGALWVA